MWSTLLNPTVEWDAIITSWSDCQEAAKPASHLQAQLLTLSTLCWCEPLPNPDSMTNSQLMSEIIHSNPVTQPHPHPSQNPHQQSWGCRWAKEGFPKGPALLSYLYSELQESDPRAAPLVRFLFLAAFQPYMQHMRSWMYSTASVAPHFGTAEGDSAGVWPQVLNQDVSGSIFTLSFSITNLPTHRSYRQTSWKQHPRLCLQLSYRTTTQER